MGTLYLGTKEEHNARREAEFLACSGAERFQIFLKMFDNPRFGGVGKEDKTNNLVLYK